MKIVSTSGFTLLEIMITVSIMGIIGLLISQVFFTTTKVNTKTELLKDIKQNGQFSMDTLVRMIRSARSVTSTCSTTGTQSTSLQITNPNGQLTTFGCFLDATGSTRIASTSGYTGQSDYLTSNNISLGGTACTSLSGMTLSFTCTSYVDQPTRVKINFSLKQIGTPSSGVDTANQAFETTVSVRN